MRHLPGSDRSTAIRKVIWCKRNRQVSHCSPLAQASIIDWPLFPVVPSRASRVLSAMRPYGLLFSRANTLAYPSTAEPREQAPDSPLAL
ncbi:hypothetical protein CERZMDRAFT_89890 [Cercospora zeae-maydis SCOH1-5]|uniref:Uncharacterized protein n=1 Tax=Cercospora zeae-maydis SCOH1-5 TaxID=717836 RepID=A0A6A6FSN3_9PEZI|nr:hypothetical protein CERZMDRAFT_89890 [Cercospora zeae-maydis SCOH1-5]